MRNFKILFALCFFAVLSLESAHAQLKMRFGGEPTFSNEEILSVDVDIKNADGETRTWEVSTPQNQKYINLFKEEVQKRCPECEIIESKNKHMKASWMVKHPNGIEFKITPDPSVVEVIVSPQFIEFFEAHKALYSSLIFEAAKKVGLRVHFSEGQGHITMMMREVFEERPLLFRNFVVDTMNHPELGLGIFEYNPLDAPPAVLTEGLVGDVERELSLVTQVEGFTVRDVANAVDRAYQSQERRAIGGATHYQALRVNKSGSMLSDARVESRTFRPQKDFDEFLSQIKLLEARVNFLATQTGLIPFREASVPTIGEAKKRFRTYVQESGLKWGDYKNYIPENWRSVRLNSHECTDHLKLLTQYDFVFRD